MEETSDFTTLDMGVTNSNISASSQPQHSTKDESSIMNPENECKSDLCKKRKAGDIEPDTMGTLRADHRVTSTDDSPRPQRLPPLKKRFSLDLLSEASAMLAQGLRPSKIQEIVKQQEKASAAMQQQPVQDIAAASDKMVLDEASKAGTQNGETSVPVQPKAVATINSEASNDTLNNKTTSQNAGNENRDTALAEKSAQKTNDQVPPSPPPQVDEEVKQNTPIPTGSETDSSVKDSMNTEVGTVKKESPIRTVSETDAPVEEPQVNKIDGIKTDTPLQTVAEAAVAAKESEETPVDNVKEDTPVLPPSSEAATAIKDESQETPADNATKDTPMQTASEADIAVKESRDVTVVDMKKDTPMAGATTEGDIAVQEPQATPAEDVKNDAPMQTASEPDASTMESQDVVVVAVKIETAMAAAATEGDNAVQEPQEEDTPPAQTASVAVILVKESLDAKSKNSSELLLPSINGTSNDGAPAASDAVESSATNGEKHNGENSAQISVDAAVKETNEENGQQVEEEKQANAEPMTTDDSVKEKEKLLDEPMTTDALFEEAKEEIGEPMSTDEVVKETNELNGVTVTSDELAKETTQAIREPVTTKVLEEMKQENGEPVTNVDKGSETKEGNFQPEATDKAIELTQEDNGKDIVDESVKDRKAENKESMITDELGEDAKGKTEELAEKTEEENRETVNMAATIKETAEENEPTVATSESPKETNDDTGEPMTSDEADKKVEEDNGEPMIIDESNKGTTAADSGVASREIENEIAVDEPATSDMPTMSNGDKAHAPHGVNGVVESSESAMHVDDTKSDELAIDNEIQPSSTADENETAGENQTAQEDKKIRNRKGDPVVLEIRRRIQFGCRDNNLSAAMTAYHEAIEKKIKVEPQSFYNLLNLCDGLERSVHVGTPKGKSAQSDGNDEVPIVDEANRLKFAFQLRDHMQELNLPLNEAAYSAIVKMLSKSKEYDQALAILEESETVQQCKPKLRLYSPLLIAYCEAYRMLDALEIWKKLTARKLHASEKEYAALMQCATSTGDAIVFERVLTDLAEDVLVPSKGTVSRILEWFELAHSFHTSDLTKRRADETRVTELLDQIHAGEKEAPPSMGPVVNVNAWQISSACPIGMKSGTLQTGCLKGCNLNPVNISQRAWNEMRDMNEKIVTKGQVEGHNTQFQGGKKGKKRMDFSQERRIKEWEGFANFLESIGHVDVVVDGANVGCFEKNFARAPKHIDYHQVDWVVQHFSKMGKKVLVVLHERHFAKHMMPDEFRWLEQKWLNDKNLYKTPRGMNDDWFWLHVAYTHQSLVVSNDEMRDHHFQMLAPRTFLRWKERHHAHFDFGNWITAEDRSRQKEVLLTLPEAYSRRLQRVEDGLVIPLAKRGDSNRFMDGGHVASDDEPEEETYLCIRPNSGQP